MPFSEESLQRLLVLRKEIDRIFRDFFEPREEGKSAPIASRVVCDVFEREGEFIIEAELPGVSKEDLELSVLRDILIVEGRKPKTEDDENMNYHCMERSFGAFRRIVEIPGTGDTRNMRARFADGLLTVRLPKIPDRRGQRRKVPIE